MTGAKIYAAGDDKTIEVGRSRHSVDLYVRLDVTEGRISHHTFALLTTAQARQLAGWLVYEAAEIDGEQRGDCNDL